MRQRSAFTILEVIISVTIFVMMVAVVMESMVAMRSYVAFDESEFSLDVEARRVARMIQQDLSTSAWYLPMDIDEKFDLLDPDLDREIRYYPYILNQDGGEGDLFSHFERDADAVVTAADFPDGWVVPNTHKLPSQEIVFVKIGRNAAVDDPSTLRPTPVNFNNTPTVAFNRFWEGDVIPNMRLQTEGVTVVDVGLFFETDTSDNLREYSYGIRPNAGFRELWKICAHREDNGQTTSSAGIEGVQLISRYVDRIVFNTCRTSPSLDVDQIGVDIYLSRRNESSLVNSRKISFVVAMRSTVDPEYSENIDAWLGTKGNFPIN